MSSYFNKLIGKTIYLFGKFFASYFPDSLAYLRHITYISIFYICFTIIPMIYEELSIVYGYVPFVTGW